MRISKPIVEDISSRELVDLLQQILKTLNGGIEIGTTSQPTINIAGKLITGVTPNPANTDFNLSHNLGKTPTGWIVVWKDQYSDFKNGVAAWNSKTITLQCNTTGVNYRIFVF